MIFFLYLMHVLNDCVQSSPENVCVCVLYFYLKSSKMIVQDSKMKWNKKKNQYSKRKKFYLEPLLVLLERKPITLKRSRFYIFSKDLPDGTSQTICSRLKLTI